MIEARLQELEEKVKILEKALQDLIRDLYPNEDYD